MIFNEEKKLKNSFYQPKVESINTIREANMCQQHLNDAIQRVEKLKVSYISPIHQVSLTLRCSMTLKIINNNNNLSLCFEQEKLQRIHGWGVQQGNNLFLNIKHSLTYEH